MTHFAAISAFDTPSCQPAAVALLALDTRPAARLGIELFEPVHTAVASISTVSDVRVMEQPPVLETVLGKRKSGHSDESNSAQWDSASSSFSLYCTAAPGYGSPSVNTSKRSKQQAFCCNDDQSVQQHFWVWDHCLQPQQRLPGAQLQPADSSTAQTFAAAKDVLQQADQMDCCASDTKPGLPRTSSAPELLKLAQADSAAWQAQHQCQQTAYLSHRDYWLM